MKKVRVGALQHCLEMDQAGERRYIPSGTIDAACNEVDANCKAGDHWKLNEAGRCVWCGVTIEQQKSEAA